MSGESGSMCPIRRNFSFGSCSLPQILGTNGLVVVVVDGHILYTLSLVACSKNMGINYKLFVLDILDNQLTLVGKDWFISLPMQ